MASSLRIVIVGDVHDDWNLLEDSKAFELLQPDLVLFTGRFSRAMLVSSWFIWKKDKDGVQLQLERYGVHNMNESAKRISEAALGTLKNHSIIFLAHKGPTGLGSNMNDICGRDWVCGGRDHGDPGNTKHYVPLVVFGHMHNELAFGKGPRKMIVVGDDNTIYLNGAIVPRSKDSVTNNTHCSSSSTTDTLPPNSEGALGAFTLVESEEGKLEKIAETWVSVIGDNTTAVEEHILFSNNVCTTSNL